MELRRFAALPRWLASSALACAVLLGVAAPLKRASDKWPVAVGVESRQQYLTRHEPTYLVAAVANQLPPGAKILSQDYRAFYFQPQIVRENIYRRRTSYDQSVRDDESLRQCLAAGGFTHVLLCDVAGGVPQDNTLADLIDRYPVAVRPLFDQRVAHVDGERRYRLFEVR